MPLSRRQFLCASALALPALRLSAWAKPLPWPPGLQIYTLQKEAEKDLAGTLRKVREIGYEVIEPAGFYGHSAAELRKIADQLGLKVRAAHIFDDKPDLKTAWTRFLGELKEVNAEYAVLPSAPREKFTSVDGIRYVADQFNALAKQANDAGLKFAYHCHNFEFAPVGDARGYDHLLRHTDPKLVGYEMDVYWVVDGGADPVHYLEAYPGRFPLLHVKDRKPGSPTSTGPDPQDHSTEVGRGSIDWPRVFRAAEKSGTQGYFVEQEEFTGSPFDAIATSLKYLRHLQV